MHLPNYLYTISISLENVHSGNFISIEERLHWEEGMLKDFDLTYSIVNTE